MQVAIALFPGNTALDAVGPYEVLQRVPSFDVVFVGHRRGEVRSDNAMLGLLCDAAFDELTRPDVVIFPGGIGTRTLIHDQTVLDWVREAHRHTLLTTSVCTGGLVLAAAGLLNGLTATTHWRVQDLFNSLGARYVPPACRRASARAGHHRRRGVERDRHGIAAGGAFGQPGSRRSEPADDRV